MPFWHENDWPAAKWLLQTSCDLLLINATWRCLVTIELWLLTVYDCSRVHTSTLELHLSHVSFNHLPTVPQCLTKAILWLFTDQHSFFSTRSLFVTLLSRRAQSGRWSSFRKRVWFTESHLVLIISFLLVVLFTQFIVDKILKSHSVSS